MEEVQNRLVETAPDQINYRTCLNFTFQFSFALEEKFFKEIHFCENLRSTTPAEKICTRLSLSRLNVFKTKPWDTDRILSRQSSKWSPKALLCSKHLLSSNSSGYFQHTILLRVHHSITYLSQSCRRTSITQAVVDQNSFSKRKMF